MKKEFNKCPSCKGEKFVVRDFVGKKEIESYPAQLKLQFVEPEYVQSQIVMDFCADCGACLCREIRV